MRRRISWLVAATTSAVVLAFVIPLALLVRTLAEDRALTSATQEAQGVSALVAAQTTPDQLAELVRLLDERSRLSTSVWLPDGTVVGPAKDGVADAVRLARARAGTAFTSKAGDGAGVYLPVVVPQGTAVIRTSVPGAELHRGLARAWAILGALGVVLLAGAVLAADRMGRRVAAPISAVSLVAHRLRSGDLEARAQLRGTPEVVDLASSVNRLAERVVELLRLEREAVADLSHRLRTPVTALRLDADAVADAALRERLVEHVEHLQRTVDSIVRSARRPVLNPVGRSCDAGQVVRERIRFWSALAADTGREVTAELVPGPVLAAIDAGELADVLDVLLDNVFAHTPEGAGFTVALSHDGAGSVRLEVIDEGTGFDPTMLRRGASGAGSTGLGLDIVRQAAQAAGGDLDLRRTVRGSTAAVVTLAPPPR
jgi:signal transduction histidine kinase